MPSATTNPNNVKIDEDWTIEPELSDAPPRRVVESGATDYNRPNATLFFGIGGGAAVAGLVLLILGLSGGKTLFSILGPVLMLGGGALAAFAPQQVNRHLARARHLVENGVPVPARLLSADNMGSEGSMGRIVKYQVSLPNGELVHRQVNCDDRVLPRRIPANVTALWDTSPGSTDVELYCALPFKATSKTYAVPAPRATTPVAPTVMASTTAPAADPLAGMPTTAPTAGTGMGTIGVAPASRPAPVVAAATPVASPVEPTASTPPVETPETPPATTEPKAEPKPEPKVEKKSNALPWE